MRLFGPVMEGLAKAVDLYQARHRVIAENIANAETPGYRARDLDFASSLRQAFEPGRDRGEADTADAITDVKAKIKIDGNSIDLDTEMGRLNENSFKTEMLSRLLARKYQGLRSVIQGGTN